MKSTIYFFLLVFLLPITVRSQSGADTGRKPRSDVYMGLSTDFLRDFNVNEALEQAGLQGFRQSTFGATLGVNMYIGNGLLNVEGEVKSNWGNVKDDQSTVLRYLPASIGYFHRVIGKAEGPSVLLGCSYNLTLFNADVYSKNSSIDLSNLAQEDLRGSLNLNALSHGAAFSILLNSETDNSWHSGSALKISYILDLAKPDWASNSVNLSNSRSENFSRFNIMLTRPIKKRQ